MKKFALLSLITLIASNSWASSIMTGSLPEISTDSINSILAEKPEGIPIVKYDFQTEGYHGSGIFYDYEGTGTLMSGKAPNIALVDDSTNIHFTIIGTYQLKQTPPSTETPSEISTMGLIPTVPLPAAVWLFVSAMFGLILIGGKSRRVTLGFIHSQLA